MITFLLILVFQCVLGIKLFFNFKGVLLTMRGCTHVLRGCSSTLKTPNSLPQCGCVTVIAIYD